MKVLSIFFIVCLLTVKLFSQDCSGFKAFKSVKLRETICYSQDFWYDSTLNIYHTKYIISSVNNKDLYLIEFQYFKLFDSVVINYKDSINKISDHNKVLIDQGGSGIMFKDYVANDTSINQYAQCSMLFTIPEAAEPYVTLNNFKPLGNPDIFITITEVNPDKLEEHNRIARNYLITRSITDSLEIESKVDSLISYMNEYLINKKKEIQSEDETILNKPPEKASLLLSNEFKNLLDTTISNLVSDSITFKEIIIKILNFKFYCNAKGEIDFSKPGYENQEELEWFQDSIGINLKQIIGSLNFKTIRERIYSNDLWGDFMKNVNERREKINMNPEQWDRYTKTREKIQKEFDLLSDREINLPTIYNYRVIYKSTIRKAKWKYKIKKDGNDEVIEIPENKKSEQNDKINQDLVDIFKKKIVMKDKSKYDIRICEIFLNGYPISDIEPVRK